jgi:hypothetical protein
MSVSEKLKSQFVRPVVVGIISAIGAKAMGLKYDVGVPLLGDVSAPVFYGVLGTASSLATETIHQWVLPYLPQSDSAVKAENALLSPIIHAALNVGVLKLAYPGILNEMGYKDPIALGIGAEFAGEYAFESFVKPAIAGW